jgi:hypothetical protein
MILRAESSAIIESQLYAYFPSTHIGQQWNNYSRIVDFSYLLIHQTDVTTRRMYVKRDKGNGYRLHCPTPTKLKFLLLE